MNRHIIFAELKKGIVHAVFKRHGASSLDRFEGEDPNEDVHITDFLDEEATFEFYIDYLEEHLKIDEPIKILLKEKHLYLDTESTFKDVIEFLIEHLLT